VTPSPVKLENTKHMDSVISDGEVLKLPQINNYNSSIGGPKHSVASLNSSVNKVDLKLPDLDN
jgi:hypothetical protein